MPQVGEIKKAQEIGYRGHDKRIWVRCQQCGNERWVSYRASKPISKLCTHCHCHNMGKALKGKYGAEKGGNYKGGRAKATRGYYRIRVYPNDFFYPMADCLGYVLEHRLVVAKALGRNLHRWEIVHHKEGCAKDDNRYPQTLQLVTDDRHNQITILENQIKQLEKENRELRRQIK